LPKKIMRLKNYRAGSVQSEMILLWPAAITAKFQSKVGLAARLGFGYSSGRRMKHRGSTLDSPHAARLA
jgi:hypothetical protein